MSFARIASAHLLTRLWLSLIIRLRSCPANYPNQQFRRMQMLLLRKLTLCQRRPDDCEQSPVKAGYFALLRQRQSLETTMTYPK